MAEYIEREAAVMKIREWFWSAPGVHPKLGRDTAEEILFAIPAADVAPILRCKDCKYAEIIERDWGDSEMYCMSRGSCCFSVIARDYCSRAERLEAEGEQ